LLRAPVAALFQVQAAQLDTLPLLQLACSRVVRRWERGDTFAIRALVLVEL
jgi:hypothetical protein